MCRTAQRTWLRVSSVGLGEELKALTLRLSYFYFVLLDCFLQFPTLLIKFTLWNSRRPGRLKFFCRQEAGGGHGRGVQWGGMGWFCPRKTPKSWLEDDRACASNKGCDQACSQPETPWSLLLSSDGGFSASC